MSRLNPPVRTMSLTRPMAATLTLMLCSIAAAVASPEVDATPEVAHCQGEHLALAYCTATELGLPYLYWHQGSSRLVPPCALAVPG